jgi:tetraacyldisaccharide-1-P 4'-kinase
MSVSWTERARGQLDLPLGRRHPLFMLFSVFLAFPLSLVWALAASLRLQKRINRNAASHSDDPWIISIGNVAVGGTGKSPVVRALAKKALADGYDVAVLSRGHSATTSDCVLIELSGQEEAQLLTPPAGLWSSGFSDECLEHALVLGSLLRRNETLWIAQGRDRAQAMSRLLDLRKSSMQMKSSCGETKARRLLILLDDGLSQTSVAVHRDVVVWDPATVLTAPRASMPFGPYRMGWPGTFWSDSLPRADLVVWSRLVDEGKTAEFQSNCSAARELLGLSSVNPAFHPESGSLPQRPQNELYAVEQPYLARANSNTPAQGFALEVVTPDVLRRSYTVLTGLARPQRFVQTVVKLLCISGDEWKSCDPKDALHLADHGRLSQDALNLLSRPEPVVTSLKDLCRWWNDPALQAKMKKGDLYVLCLDVELRSLQGNAPFDAFATIFNPESEARKTDGKS